MIAELVERARELGALAVVAHGETIVEPVPPGTNRAAIEAGVDVLAHPGLLSFDDARRAAEKGVHLEISARSGHSLSNGHVATLARQTGAALVFGTDTHSPDNITARAQAERIARGAGLSDEEVRHMFANAARLLGLEELEKVKLE
jgi:histidinol phosphatase-like PHP family hydrolase